MAKTKIPGEYLKDSVVRFTAKAGENITKGQSVYISGISGEVPVVSLADADDTNKMPAFGLAESTVSTNGSIEVTSNGTLAGIDTSSYALGDILYISTTAGSLTNDPSGLEASKVQNIGMVQRVHASNGSIKVGGAGRTNATPNLNDGNIFVGNSSNKSVSDAFTDVLNDQAGINSSANATAITIDSSENVGIGVTSVDATLHVHTGADTTFRVSGDRGNANDLHIANIEFENTFGSNGVIAEMRAITGNSGTQSTKGQLAFYTDDGSTYAERLRIDQSGNVGIGTSSPSANLEIAQSGNNVGLLVSGGGYNYTAKFESSDAEANIIIEDSNSTNNGNMIGVATDDMYFLTAGSERMRIDSSGNVGIGISPDYKLHIEAAGNNLKLSRSGVGEFAIGVASGRNLVFEDKTAAAERMRIDSSGTVLFKSGAFPTNQDSPFIYRIGGGSLAIGAATETGTAAHAAFYTNSLERMRIDSSGNLLVGKTANDNTTVGGSIRAGESTFTANDSRALTVGRNTNDGDLIQFRKATGTVGSIGTSGD